VRFNRIEHFFAGAGEIIVSNLSFAIKNFTSSGQLFFMTQMAPSVFATFTAVLEVGRSATPR